LTDKAEVAERGVRREGRITEDEGGGEATKGEEATCTHGFEEGGDGRRTEGPVLTGYTRGVGEAVNMGGDVESGVAGKFKGDGVHGGSGREGGEVQGPETVPGCPAAGKERRGFGGGVGGDGGVGESGGAVRSHEGGDGEEVVVEVSVRARETGGRMGVVGEAEGSAGGGPKDSAVGEIEGGRGDENRGKEGSRRRREEARRRTCVAPESGRKGEPGIAAENIVEGGGDDNAHSS
jgi:hypothetical protein